ncbi:MAG: hypothetical protein FWD66_04250 [Paludibacter sp.]|nr:hypothetical protein [Paludibacter sp.]
MTKKIVLTFIAAIFFYTTFFSQELDHISYDKWVDFVKCKYVEAYFNKKIDDKSIAQIFRNDYNIRIKQQLADVSFENASSRVKVLEPLKSYNEGRILIDFIESKKANFDKTKNKSSLIENLLALPTSSPNDAGGNFDTILSEEKAKLITLLQKELLPQTTEIQNVMKDSAVAQSKTNVQETKFYQNTTNKLPFKWIIIATFALILIVIWLLFKDKIKLLTAHNYVQIDENDLLAKITQLETDNKNLTDKIFLISFKNDELKREIDKISSDRDIAYMKIRELEKITKNKNKLF